MKNKKWLLPAILGAAVVVLFIVLFATASMRLPISYGSRLTIPLSEEDEGYESYLAAVNLSAQGAGNAEKAWGGDWPDYYGGLGVVENEGEYLVRAWLTEDTEENRKAIREATGLEIRAYTTTNVSWSDLVKTLEKVDAVSSIPFMQVDGMGIRAEERCVRAYLSHRNAYTIAMLGLADFQGLLEIVIAPPKPGTSTEGITEEHTVTMTLSDTEYVTGYEIQLSTDPFFMEGEPEETEEGEVPFQHQLKSIENPGSVTEITFTGLEAAEQWYVRGRSWLDVDGQHYESGWSSIKAVK